MRNAAGTLALMLCAASAAAGAADPFRITLVAGVEPAASDASASLARLRTALEDQPGTLVSVATPAGGAGALPSLELLRTADAAVLHGGACALSANDAALLRDFLDRGRGLLVIREDTSGWDAWPDFAATVLGARRKGDFAGGEPMRVINLFAHAVFTGVPRLETRESMPLYDELAPDAMMIIEGTVGEATAPLAWLRRTAAGRVAHVLPSDPALFKQPEYLRFLVNSVHWVAGRPIAGARAIVQRTYLPDAYPGAIAITLPEGPTACFDPARGGVSQVAAADFVDLRPRWITKRGEPARIAGGLFFQDAGRELLWRGAGDGGAPPAFRFKGYSVRNEYPELHYEVGDRRIRETMRPGASGALVRELHIGAGAQPLRYRHDPALRGALTVRGAPSDARGFAYESTLAGLVTIEIGPPPGRTP